MKNELDLSLEELETEYKALQSILISTEDRLEEVYWTYGMEYTRNVMEDNEGKIALCPVCDHLMEIQVSFARCPKCEVGIFVRRHTDKSEDYIVSNHNFPNIDQAIVATRALNPDTMLPPEVFSIQLYNSVIRPQIFCILKNYGIIDLDTE